MPYVSFQKIKKVFPNGFVAVQDFNLDINQGEFIVFVGPSGCGKTTTLRMLAGLEEISDGTISLNDQIINDFEPKDRNIAMVFQNYALYPHMTIYDNMAYGLKVQKLDAKLIRERIMDAIKILGFPEDYLKRRPAQLSGGQKQRVALGRTIVRRPAIFLMDEPLSNLDAKLRVQMRYEITKIHKEIGATTIYVTHDQIEAMTMADRIVVMNDGHIQQIGTPTDIYEHPENLFVANFVGSPAMNLFDGHYQDGNLKLSNETSLKIPPEWESAYRDFEGQDVVIGFRPDDCHINYARETTPSHRNVLPITIDAFELLGHETIIYATQNGLQWVAKQETMDLKEKAIHRNSVSVQLEVSAKRMHVFDKATGKRIKVEDYESR